MNKCQITALDKEIRRPQSKAAFMRLGERATMIKFHWTSRVTIAKNQQPT
jgi:hypothetical protein